MLSLVFGFSLAMRSICPEHGLARGPDGQCVVCRRAEAGNASRERRARGVWPVLTVLLAGGLLIGALWAAMAWHQSRGAEVDGAGQSIRGEPRARAPAGRSAEPRRRAAAPPSTRGRGLQERQGHRAAEPPPATATTGTSVAVLGHAGAAAATAADSREPAEGAADKMPLTQADLDRALGLVQVAVYTRPTCPVCRRALAWLSVSRTRFVELDVSKSVQHERALHRLNPSGSVPTFDVDGQTVIGFSEARLARALAQAATRRLGQ